MSRLPILSSKKVITALIRAGFEDAPRKGKGSHIALVKRTSGTTRLVIIPKKKSLPKRYPTSNLGSSWTDTRGISGTFIVLFSDTNLYNHK